MTADLQAALENEPRDHQRPNVSGDLPTVLHAAPMFRRVVSGYDRFQVDTYVRWAEDELATADRERTHLEARHMQTWAALEDARQLLSHSSGGSEFLQLSRRTGTMLAAAADEAERIMAQATSARSHAAGQATRTIARAERVLADAVAEAERMVTEAATEVAAATAEARRIVAAAEQTERDARAAAAGRLDSVRLIEERATQDAEHIRRRAVAEAVAARLQARDEVVRMLSTGREARRRADAEAAATRERLDRDAVTRTASLVADVTALEHRRASLRTAVEAPAPPVARPTAGGLDAHLPPWLEKFRWRSRSVWAP
jgi:hypothetical protein